MEVFGDILRTAVQIAYAMIFLGALGLMFLVPLALLVYTFADIFNRDDIGAGKLVWSLVVLLVPLIGLALYWLSRPTADQDSLTAASMRRTAQLTDDAQRAASLRRAA